MIGVPLLWLCFTSEQSDVINDHPVNPQDPHHGCGQAVYEQVEASQAEVQESDSSATTQDSPVDVQEQEGDGHFEEQGVDGHGEEEGGDGHG